MGIVAITKGDIKKDYLQIKYKDDGKLYIPVEKIDLISKYSSNEGVVPKLNKLGGVEWQKTKMRIRSKIKDIADMLLKISAERAAQEGYAFSKDTEEQIEFESEFIYDETKDQLLTTKQIKEDMESKVPMDRILCGDVGYGKTEVAFRAMFKAVCNNKQVAYLCPTTLLSNQQYNNALERFKNFPVNIALLNRFTTPKETARIIEGISNKTIDIVFGTHRLLSKDIKFKDLGLLVIDEEQRFGVMHKEKIKEYKANVDVLTLSATPIPRTLQMAMVGLRNLSLIETPPVDRYPIQTYVLEENDYVIKDAIYKEISRDGQVYILYNNIEKIENKAQEIRNLVSDAKVVFVHGQMNKIEIENIMLDFINRKYDVLVCTTIIETGIDIPNVNTLIVIDADKFGLSQLYQIRGRVGRTNKIAYAYLMYNKRKVLSDIAVKRLSAIKEFTELGSGFNIAVRDLAIRGSGDILGSEQSGFIDTIGIELYTKMLNEEVNKLKGINVEDEEQEDEQPLINVETHIEDSYVDIDEIKIEIHKKINEIDSYEKLLSVKNELEDRFGTISDSLLLYMHEEWFEKIAREKGIEKINQNKNSIELVFNSEFTSKIDINSLFQKAYEICKMFRFSYSNNKLKIILDTIKLEKHWLYYCLDLLNNIDK
jgi:transcription-repair coupling factor (superfamily II helicase)